MSCVQIPRHRYGALCGSLLCPIRSPVDFPFPPLQRSTTIQNVSSKAASGTSGLFRLSCKVLLHNTASRRLIGRHADNETKSALGQGATINLTDNWVTDLSHKFAWGALLSQTHDLNPNVHHQPWWATGSQVSLMAIPNQTHFLLSVINVSLHANFWYDDTGSRLEAKLYREDTLDPRD